jgi:alpha-tubulin suppressor-like RCC1 family protein
VIKSISTGEAHSAMVTEGETTDVYVWGDNSYAQLGVILQLEQHCATVPIKVQNLSNLDYGKVTKVFCTERSTHAVFKIN